MPDDGLLSTWGEGLNGQLGCGDVEKLKFPTKLEGVLQGRAARVVPTGTRHLMILTESGMAFSCRHAGNRKLGHGNSTVAEERPAQCTSTY